MIHLVFASPRFEQLKTEMLRTSNESVAVLMTTEVRTQRGSRLLVREIHHASNYQVDYRSPHSVQLKAVEVARLSRMAREANQGLVFVHTHPESSEGGFSNIDDAGEKRLRDFLDRRNLGRTHVAMLITPRTCRARTVGSSDSVAVLQIGRDLQDVAADFNRNLERTQDRFDRQVRVFGPAAQRRLQRFRVAIVGLGGIGSAVAQQLAHLGVSEFLLIDPDIVEASNLNRLLGARATDVGQSKVDIAARCIAEVRPDASVERQQLSVLTELGARRLLESDLIFACTDSHGSRAVINQLAYQYLIPTIDTGVSISVEKQVVKHVAGRVQMLAPGLGCLTCAELLNSDAVRRDLMSDYERQQDPYFTGPGEPQPAVVSINSTVASLAVTMFLSAVASIPVEARFQMYNAIAGTVRAVRRDPVAACVVCSDRGALARGDEWPLPTRRA